ncbi:hypothetical protein LCGC14_0337680 [marine sediment metagenome]|uniref:Uncharacterized protein n=1 Tax=marine sediment metagenome TaxID=412755 RepID=A0A0F9W224_9ZZZZ
MNKKDFELSKEIQYWAGRLIGHDQAYDIAEEIVEAIKHSEQLQSSQSEAVEFAEFLGKNNRFCRHNDFSGKSIWYKLNKNYQMFTTNELFNSSEFKKFKESRLKDSG